MRIVVASALLVALVPPSSFALRASEDKAVHTQARTYDALLALFKEWRAFEEAPRLNGVPDYSAATNTRRLGELRRLQDRLQAIDTNGWSIPERVDHHVVRAEMNGMDTTCASSSRLRAIRRTTHRSSAQKATRLRKKDR